MERVCRTCISSEAPVRSLFEADSDLIEFHIKLYSCFPTVNFDDSDFPTTMCVICIEKLQNAYKFRQLCIKTACTFLEKRKIKKSILNVTTNDKSNFSDAQKATENNQKTVLEIPNILLNKSAINTDSSNNIEISPNINDSENISPDDSICVNLNKTADNSICVNLNEYENTATEINIISSNFVNDKIDENIEKQLLENNGSRNIVLNNAKNINSREHKNMHTENDIEDSQTDNHINKEKEISMPEPMLNDNLDINQVQNNENHDEENINKNFENSVNKKLNQNSQECLEKLDSLSLNQKNIVDENEYGLNTPIPELQSNDLNNSEITNEIIVNHEKNQLISPFYFTTLQNSSNKSRKKMKPIIISYRKKIKPTAKIVNGSKHETHQNNSSSTSMTNNKFDHVLRSYSNFNQKIKDNYLNENSLKETDLNVTDEKIGSEHENCLKETDKNVAEEETRSEHEIQLITHENNNSNGEEIEYIKEPCQYQEEIELTVSSTITLGEDDNLINSTSIFESENTTANNIHKNYLEDIENSHEINVADKEIECNSNIINPSEEKQSEIFYRPISTLKIKTVTCLNEQYLNNNNSTTVDQSTNIQNNESEVTDEVDDFVNKNTIDIYDFSTLNDHNYAIMEYKRRNILIQVESKEKKKEIKIAKSKEKKKEIKIAKSKEKKKEIKIIKSEEKNNAPTEIINNKKSPVKRRSRAKKNEKIEIPKIPDTVEKIKSEEIDIAPSAEVKNNKRVLGKRRLSVKNDSKASIKQETILKDNDSNREITESPAIQQPEEELPTKKLKFDEIETKPEVSSSNFTSIKVTEIENDKDLKFPFECTLCNVRTRTIKALRKHLNVHIKKENAFLCESCPKWFRTPAGLAVHKARMHRLTTIDKIHLKNRPYCVVCKQIFPTYALSWIHHIKYHN